MSKSSSSSNYGCVLWLILGALLFIGLTLAGFSTTSSTSWAAGLVLGGACIPPLFFCGIIGAVLLFVLGLFFLIGVLESR